MRTFELGYSGVYHLYLREWDGVGRSECDRVARLTDEEAQTLRTCGYLVDNSISGDPQIDPTTLLSVQLIDAWCVVDDHYIPGVTSEKPWMVERLIITLPEITTPFVRTAIQLADPWWFSSQQGSLTPDRKTWIDKFRIKPQPLEWPDNPTEATDGW